ncbi:hypothetical protein Dimus_000063 [Dionaea muscipula]
MQSIFCLKNMSDMTKIEKTEDCFILDFDPFDTIDLSKLSLSKHDNDKDLLVIAEKGKVACRDYAHSRHLCLKHPFDTTPHKKYCDLCYCFVCDKPAPCKEWDTPAGMHCDAKDAYDWILKRSEKRTEEQNRAERIRMRCPWD